MAEEETRIRITAVDNAFAAQSHLPAVYHSGRSTCPFSYRLSEVKRCRMFGAVLSQVLRTLALAIQITSVASANAQSLKDQVTGTWMLVSAEVVQSDGTRANMFGAQPRGILVLSADGTYVTINTRSDVPRIAAGNRDKATDEEAKAITQGALVDQI